MTRPRRRASYAAASRSRPPASPIPPPQARGASAGQFSHWPHPGGGASSSGISTTGAWSPAVGTGACGTTNAVVAAAVVTAAAAASCRDPTATAAPRSGLLIAAALFAACGALDERRLMGTDASDLSALAGARAGTVSATLRTQKHRTELQPLKTKGARGECRLPQAREAPLPFPRGFGRRPHGACHCRCRSRRRPCGARRRLCDARSLLY
jgi:hypothetical protein